MSSNSYTESSATATNSTFASGDGTFGSMNSEDSSFADSGDFPYRVLSKGAIASLVLAVLSLLGLLFPGILLLAAVGAIAGYVSASTIKRYPAEFTGRSLANLGLCLNVLILASGVGFHSYVYATEVPEGYERISFSDLQPENPNGPAYPPDRALLLNGKDIFIKGYMYPDDKAKSGVSKFVLIPDLGTCCFGGQPKLTDMVEVTLRDPLRLRYNYSRRKLAGKLAVDRQLKPITGLQGVYYQLDASFAQ